MRRESKQRVVVPLIAAAMVALLLGLGLNEVHAVPVVHALQAPAAGVGSTNATTAGDFTGAEGMDGVFVERDRAFLQATWLPVSYNCGSAEQVQSVLQRLKQEGVRRVYVCVWNQGVVYMQSPTMRTLMGSSTTPALGRDILRWAVDAGRGLGLEIYAWFEYGLMCSYGDLSNAFASTVSRKGWVLGQYNSFYWMDPGRADVGDFMVGILRDAIDGYAALGLKGVQLDDHFGSPVSLGATASEVNALMSRISADIRARNPAMVRSLSPSILSLSKNTYQADWNAWGSQRYYDEVLPQLYRSDYASYKSIFDETIRSISSTTRSLFLAAGVRVDGSGSPTPWNDVNSMIQYSKQNGVGNSIWYARGILDLYPQYFGTTW
eukprot:TRINITY_DN2695_c0_g1_i1.p1 TRINITY_DN2695_c0_g1~~TRINITY_DN2695_c0_g1_i1.p1  ORF type:complete len:378 (-),score=47.83 TRINITY_DN2695_c0_g1_i1:291-1424(-)